jgi:flagellar motor switch protein FliG
MVKRGDKMTLENTAQILKGPQKAAAFILSLDEDRVAKILSFLEPDDLQTLSKEMATLGAIESKTIEQIYLDFQKHFSSGVGAVVGSIEKTEKMLLHVFPPDKVASIMANIVGPIGNNLWEKLEAVDNDFLVTFLQTEHPQTIAVILTKISPGKAAAIFKLLPKPLSQDVMVRVLKLDTVSKEVLNELEKTLRAQFINNASKTNKRDAHQIIADIFNLFDRESEEKFRVFLESTLPADAERVKELMFTFEDMVRIDDKGIQEIIRIVDKTKLALALKGASGNIKNLFFRNMSERAGKLLKEDVESLGRTRLKEVDEAQTAVIAQVKELIEKEIITARVVTDQEEEKYVD